MEPIKLDKFNQEVITTFVERWQIARLGQSSALHTGNQRKLLECGVFMDVECRGLMRHMVELYQEQNLGKGSPPAEKEQK